MPSWGAGRTPAAAVARRALERRLGTPPDGGQAPRRYLYDVLMSVAIRNDYFNLDGGLCRGINTRPTPTTRRLMQDLGLLFREDAAGFRVLYDANRTASLIDYLRRQGPPPVWTRLSFIVELLDRRFVSFTDVPVDLNPSLSNFYFTNRGPHQRRHEEVVLNRGSHVTAPELVPTIPVQFGVNVSDRVDRIDVRDIAGQVVMSEPRCVTSSGQTVCRAMIYLDFSHLPEDEYTVQEVGPHGTILRAETVLYTETYPIALAFIDLLFTSPSGALPENFPVRDLFQAQPEVEGVDYVVQFVRRAVPWRYYVVPRRTPLEHPHIEGPAPFLGPDEVTLPDGAPAFRFTSAGALPLLQEPQERFRLSGRLGPNKPNRVLIDPLPWASPGQVVVQATPDGPLALSEMYVYL